MSDATATVTDEDQPVVDAHRQPLLDALRAELGEALVGSEIAKGDLWVRVHRSAWRHTFEYCRTHLGMEYFCFLAGLDWLPAPTLSGEKVFEPAEGIAIDTTDDDDDALDGSDADEDDVVADEAPGGADQQRSGVAGGDTRFQVFARLYSVTDHIGITLKADLDDEDPRIESVHDIYAGADWHEREAWEMYGFDFAGHPGLRHIYLPGEFEGHPLRKDFPLLAREVKPWPGIVDVEPLPGEPADTADIVAGAEG